MTCKVIGFNGKIGKEVRTRDGKRVTAVARTAKVLMTDPVFTKACAQTVEKLNAVVDETGIGKKIELATLITKRQASKFYRGEGIVYQNTIGKEVVSEG